MPALDSPTSFAEMAMPMAGFAVLAFATTMVSMRLPVFKHLSWESRFYCATCVTALLNASCVSYTALASLYEMFTGPDAITVACGVSNRNVARAPAPANAVFVCWLTVGYFIQDCLLLVLYRKDTMAGLGGKTGYIVQWVHHGASIAIWPWAISVDAANAFVIYYLATEVSNIFQNSYFLIARGGFISDPKTKSLLELKVAGAWLVLFTVVRVLPIPYIVYAYIEGLALSGGCGMPTVHWLVALFAVPIPIMLNMMWFKKMVAKYQRMLKKAKADGFIGGDEVETKKDK